MAILLITSSGLPKTEAKAKSPISIVPALTGPGADSQLLGSGHLRYRLSPTDHSAKSKLHTESFPTPAPPVPTEDAGRTVQPSFPPETRAAAEIGRAHV